MIVPLMQAIDETARLITSLEFTHDQDPDIDRGPIDSALNEAVAVCLRDSAEAMRTGAVAPNPAKLDEQREVHADLIAEWCRQQLAAGNSDQVRPGSSRPPTFEPFPDRRVDGDLRPRCDGSEVACVAPEAWRRCSGTS